MESEQNVFLDIYNYTGYRFRLKHWDRSSLIDFKEQIERCIPDYMSDKGLDIEAFYGNEKSDLWQFMMIIIFLKRC